MHRHSSEAFGCKVFFPFCCVFYYILWTMACTVCTKSVSLFLVAQLVGCTWWLLAVGGFVCVRPGNRCAGTLPLEALKAIISIAASHSPEFSLMHVDVSRVYFHAKARRTVLVKLPAEDCSGNDRGKIGLLKKSMYGTRDAASNWEETGKRHLENWGYELARSSRNL